LSNEGKRKGLDRLWDCLRLLKQKTDLPFFLYITGREWSQEIVPPELRGEIYIGKNIDIQSPDLPMYYAGLDYYICTSRAEGGPYPVLEAMSCACVVISTPVGVVPEVIKSGENGFLLNEETIAEDFVNIVKQTARDYSLRMQYGQSARKTIVDSMFWDVVVKPDQYEEVYYTAIKSYYGRPVLQRINIFVHAWIATVRHIRYAIGLRAKLRQILIKWHITINRATS
jgi:glycosyltransferase involved in cell wall biosynthesis